MHSIRDILKQDRTGFMSLQNWPQCSDMALLIAFGPKIDPLALEIWLGLEGTKSWTQTAFKVARHLRYRSLTGVYAGMPTVEYSVKQERITIPQAAIEDATAIYEQVISGKRVTDRAGDYEWLNGG